MINAVVYIKSEEFTRHISTRNEMMAQKRSVCIAAIAIAVVVSVSVAVEVS